MATFSVDRSTGLPADEAWRRLTGWERHSAVIPLTEVTVTARGEEGVGTAFNARTRFLGVAFDDPMEVVAWQPPRHGAPGRCRVEKRGRWVLGWNEIEVRPEGTGSRAVWREDLRLRWQPRWCDPVVGFVSRRLFGRAVDRLLATP
ncbi:SRPBCC family protein [Streptomyces phytohabitans]|uniref:SRPBCC family protein n=1 Tax=Streptomyces phytohabitans TaxID=1150371 RepID=UPI00345C2D15